MKTPVLTVGEIPPGGFKTINQYASSLMKTALFSFQFWNPRELIYVLHDVAKKPTEKITVRNANEIVVLGTRLGVVTDSGQVVSIPMSLLYSLLTGGWGSGIPSNDPDRPNPNGVTLPGLQVTSKNQETFWVPVTTDIFRHYN